MEADISIWRKTGHFYFALTRVPASCSCKVRMSGLCKVEMSACARTRWAGLRYRPFVWPNGNVQSLS